MMTSRSIASFRFVIFLVAILSTMTSSPITNRLHNAMVSAFVIVPPTGRMKTLSSSPPPTTTSLHLDLISMMRNYGKKVEASHILIGPSTSVTGRGMIKKEATAKLLQLKEEIDNDPVKFAQAAQQHSSCRASFNKGGDLGEFGPGLMVGPIDQVCFNEAVGIVHGPISSPYGEHLVLIRQRTGEE